MCEDELPQRVVHGEAIHRGAFHRNHQLRRRSVHCEAACNKIRTRAEQVLFGALCVRREQVHPEYGAHRDASVEIR